LCVMVNVAWREPVSLTLATVRARVSSNAHVLLLPPPRAGDSQLRTGKPSGSPRPVQSPPQLPVQAVDPEWRPRPRPATAAGCPQQGPQAPCLGRNLASRGKTVFPRRDPPCISARRAAPHRISTYCCSFFRLCRAAKRWAPNQPMSFDPNQRPANNPAYFGLAGYSQVSTLGLAELSAASCGGLGGLYFFFCSSFKSARIWSAVLSLIACVALTR
jgi:hypothetical protein